jgi:GH25 family lysozyme M1 (1,4-beta-N-acetylmuramidase)
MDYVLKFVNKFKELIGMNQVIYTYTSFMRNLILN